MYVTNCRTNSVVKGRRRFDTVVGNIGGTTINIVYTERRSYQPHLPDLRRRICVGGTNTGTTLNGIDETVLFSRTVDWRVETLRRNVKRTPK